MYSNICAFCEHWEICTRDIKRRIEALDTGEYYSCGRHSPAKFQGKETCSYFDEVLEL